MAEISSQIHILRLIIVHVNIFLVNKVGWYIYVRQILKGQILCSMVGFTTEFQDNATESQSVQIQALAKRTNLVTRNDKTK